MKARIITSRNLQFFVAGALFAHGFSAWIGFALSLWTGSMATAVHWAAVGIALLMAIGLLIGTRSLVRVVQIYLFIYTISLIGVVATGGPRDPRYPSVFSKVAIVVGVCEDAILLILLLWSTSKALNNATYSLTRRCSQPPAVPMSSFQMTSTLNSVAKLAAASGG